MAIIAIGSAVYALRPQISISAKQSMQRRPGISPLFSAAPRSLGRSRRAAPVPACWRAQVACGGHLLFRPTIVGIGRNQGILVPEPSSTQRYNLNPPRRNATTHWRNGSRVRRTARVQQRQVGGNAAE
jgi:hypothetical protein